MERWEIFIAALYLGFVLGWFGGWVRGQVLARTDQEETLVDRFMYWIHGRKAPLKGRGE